MKPMLAGKCEDITSLQYPLYVSPKLDGIRALVIDGVVMSRKLLPIPNTTVQKLFGHRRYNGLDGELMVGAATNGFLAGTAGIMKRDAVIDVTFHVFDDFSYPDEGFKHRYVRAIERVDKEGAHLQIVRHVHVGRPELLTTLEEDFLEQGYEGAMIRSKDGPYKMGRSTANEGYLLKLKRFEDSEAEVLGVEELEHNRNAAGRSNVGTVKRSTAKAGRVAGGVLGALSVRDVHTGATFSIGSGFDAEQRRALWQVRGRLRGQFVKYRYFPTGSKNAPRFPTFLGFRDPADFDQ